MLEFVGVVAIIIAVILLIDIKTSDEVHISFKLGDRGKELKEAAAEYAKAHPKGSGKKYRKHEVTAS